MITLHHLEYSQSFRVLWLLEELEVDYELIKYKRDPETFAAPDDYKRLSPLGTAPVITSGDLVLAETSAIFDYILDLYPNESLRPEVGSASRISYLFWSHTAQGSMMPLVLMDVIFRVIQQRVPSLLNIVIRPVLNKAAESFIEPRLSRLLECAEATLAAQTWFAGDTFSCADILLSFPIEAAKTRGYLSADYPNTIEWLDKIYARDAYVSALEKDGNQSMVMPF